MTSRRLSRIGFMLFLGAIAALLGLRFIIPLAVAPEDTAYPEAIQVFINRWLGVGSLFAGVLIAGFLLWIIAGIVSRKQTSMAGKAQINELKNNVD